MANKSREERIPDAQVEASKQIYEIARQEANLEIAKLKGEIEAAKADGIAIGAIQANKAHRSFNDFFDALILYKAHKDKSYKKNGLTWEAFCEAAGYARRTAEDIISDIAPVMETFSGNIAAFSGVGLKQIRYLGKTKAADFAGFDDDGNIVIGEERIPNTPEDILAYIDHQKEISQKAIEEKDLTVKAKDRVLKDKEKIIQKLHKNLEKLEGQAREKELTPEEDGFLKKVEKLRLGFDGYLLQLDPHRIEELFFEADPAPTPRMRAAYLSALDYMRKQILVAFDQATEMYGNAIMCPEAAWRPGMDSPLTSVDIRRVTESTDN